MAERIPRLKTREEMSHLTDKEYNEYMHKVLTKNKRILDKTTHDVRELLDKKRKPSCGDESQPQPGSE